MQGELSLAVVDKAVLALSEEKATPLADVFWSERPNTVRSGSTFMSNLDRLAEGQAPSDGGMGGGGGGFFLGSIRENIQDTAFWRGDIVTDEQGEAEVTFTLPDNLTIWVLTARGVTEGEPLVGEATIESTSTLPFFVRPTLPRFFVVGDEAEIQVALHNNTGRTIQSTVTFEASGLRLRDGAASQPLSIGAGERRVVTFPVTVQEGEAVTVSISAEGDGFSDALRETLPVYQLSAPEVIASSGLLRPGEGGAVESIQLPQESDTTQGELTLELSPSLAGATENTLAWLADFPYPSVEAVASTMLPNVATARALNELGWERPELEAALDERVRADVELLISWQNTDGGWGWWQGSESQTWLSSYSALGLHEAAQAGFPVPDETLNGATGFLQGWLARTSELQDDATLETRAFVLYVLSEMGAADVTRSVELFDRHALLGVAGRAFLLLALDNAGGEGDKVQALASELTATAILSATGAHWEEETIQPQTLGSSTRSTALAIRALVRVQPEHLLLPQAVNWLMQTRQSGHWETTQESAWSLLALTDFLLASGELDADFAYEVALNGKVILSERATRDNLAEATTLEVGIKELLLGQANELIITRVPESGAGRLYYSAWLRYFLPVETLAARNEGISLARRYESVDSATLESTGAATESVAVGDIVQVRLTVDAPNDLYFFTLEDPIPAGFEVLDPSLMTTAQGVPAPAQERVDERGPFWFDAWSSHIIRDEKVALFADRLPRGSYEYTYFLRATVPGTFNVLPAVAYEQYHPEVFGRSEGTRFGVAR